MGMLSLNVACTRAAARDPELPLKGRASERPLSELDHPSAAFGSVPSESGIQVEDDLLIRVARALVKGGMILDGVLAHAGSSYEYNTKEDLVKLAEPERSLTVCAAERLRAVGFPCPVVSIGSTPTALSAEHLEGVTEVRASVYVWFDLVMHNVGVCEISDIALSVLTTVIGHQEEKSWAIIDAGWMAMSRDRSTQRQAHNSAMGKCARKMGRCLEIMS